MTLSTAGFRQVVAFPPAPIATGWSDPCRKGLAPSQEPCLSTAHDYAFGSNPPDALPADALTVAAIWIDRYGRRAPWEFSRTNAICASTDGVMSAPVCAS
jgi:hypothetical protein